MALASEMILSKTVLAEVEVNLVGYAAPGRPARNKVNYDIGFRIPDDIRGLGNYFKHK